jgi:hypothetical protein
MAAPFSIQDHILQQINAAFMQHEGRLDASFAVTIERMRRPDNPWAGLRSAALISTVHCMAKL